MLRITITSDDQIVCCRLEGRLVGAWAAEVERVWDSLKASRQGKSCLVDLSAVAFVDEAGRRALARCYADGAQLKASGPLTSFIVEKITGPTPAAPTPPQSRAAAHGKH
jgi:anti-anti-sigma regulatory factor